MRGATDRLIAGAVFSGGQPRIVRVDDFMLEAVPEGPTILLHNHDVPAWSGRWAPCSARPASTSRACSSRSCRERAEAAMLVNVSPTPSNAVMERLRNLPNVISAQLVDLGS